MNIKPDFDADEDQLNKESTRLREIQSYKNFSEKRDSASWKIPDYESKNKAYHD